jgi:hypothetical protein
MPIDMEGICPLSSASMSETQKLVHEIEAFLRAVPMAESTFGRKAVNDGKLLGRLRLSGSVTLEKAAQIRKFMADERHAAKRASKDAAA